jgi:hypothetical protein
MSVISQASSQGLSLSDTLLGCLGWLKSSCPTGIILHPAEGNLTSSFPVRTISALCDVIDSQKLPTFRVQSSAATPDVAANTRASQPTPQQIYANHRILTLEALVEELPDNDAQIARPLFEPIRKRHSRSQEHIEDLVAMFAPVKQRNAEEWERSSQMKASFDEVSRDKSQVLKLEALVEHLDEAHAEDARAILHVVRRNLKGGRGFAGELSRLFQPVKQRNAEAWKRVSRAKKIFDELEQVSQLSGKGIAHASQTKSRGSTVGKGKRKRDE